MTTNLTTPTQHLGTPLLALLLLVMPAATWAAQSAPCGTIGNPAPTFNRQGAAGPVSFMSRSAFARAATILGIEGGRRLGSVGDAVFARDAAAVPGGLYTLVRPGTALPAPARDTTKSAPIVVTQVGSAVVERCRDGLVVLRIVDSVREVRVGDRLVPRPVAVGAVIR